MKSKIVIGIFIIFWNTILLSITTNAYAYLTIQQPPATMAPVQPVYMVELQVTSDSEKERQQNFTKALEQVLVQNSNNPKIATLSIIETALANPNDYIQRYTYANRNVTPKQSALILQIQFDQAAIVKLLQQTIPPPVPVNNIQRALVWLVKNNIIQNESSNDIIVPILKKVGQNAGITIMLPVLDLLEINNIKTRDICNFDIATIQAASQRYKAPIIIVGCIKQPTTTIKWTSQWLLLNNNKNNIFSFVGSSAEDIITQAMRAIKPIDKQPNKLMLRITNVNGLNQYNDVVQYLKTFNQITQIDLIKISTAEIELNITIIGEQPALLTVLNTQNKLIRNTDIASIPPGIDLDFKWVTASNEPQTISAKSLPQR